MKVVCDVCTTALGQGWDLALPVPTIRGKVKPLTLNDRLHHIEQAGIVAQIRGDTAWLAKQARIPPLTKARVRLLVTPPDRRRRDVDSLVATSKPAVDGLRDAGVIADDDPAHLDHLMPAITGPAGGWALTLRIVGMPA